MIKTEFMELLEELDSINEAPLKNYRIVYYEDEVKKSFTVQAASKEEAEQIGWSKVDAESLYVSEIVNEDAKSDASKKFWAAAKNKKIDEASFHAAYDEELTELGLMDIFNEAGAFINKGVYGRIKTAKDANPDSWTIKALSKLWALRYVDGVLFASEEAEMTAAVEAEEKRKAEKRAADEKLALERCEALMQEYRELIPEALKLVKQEYWKEYKAIYNTAEDQLDIEVGRSFGGYYLKVLPAHSTYSYKFNPDTVRDKLKTLASYLNTEFKDGIDNAKEAEIKNNLESNTVIDVFKANQNKQDYYCSAVCLGESGTLYYLGMSAKNQGTRIEYIKDIPEAYKVIYTRVSYSPRNYSTYSDSTTQIYESWDSSEANKISDRIPKMGKGEGSWNYWITTKVNSGDGVNYSLMDGIDSWAHTEHTSLATD